MAESATDKSPEDVFICDLPNLLHSGESLQSTKPPAPPQQWFTELVFWRIAKTESDNGPCFSPQLFAEILEKIRKTAHEAEENHQVACCDLDFSYSDFCLGENAEEEFLMKYDEAMARIEKTYQKAQERVAQATKKRDFPKIAQEKREGEADMQKAQEAQTKLEEEQLRCLKVVKAQHPLLVYGPQFFEALMEVPNFTLKNLFLKATGLQAWPLYHVLSPYLTHIEGLNLDGNVLSPYFFTHFDIFLDPHRSKVSTLSLQFVQLTDECCAILGAHLAEATAVCPLRELNLCANEGSMTQAGRASIHTAMDCFSGAPLKIYFDIFDFPGYQPLEP